ncbi:MAG TPA: hypothetical protein VEK57_10290 [Thermoanaerobaculia bacterium]|nr:hypothetical protein [Thermoanaerobaculia bacterium]
MTLYGAPVFDRPVRRPSAGSVRGELVARDCRPKVGGPAGRRPALRKIALLSLLLSLPLSAQILTSTPRGVVVAHTNRIQLSGGWTADGVENPTSIVTGEDRVAVLDALNDEAVIVELASGRATRLKTAATPVAATFLGKELYVLARDARVLQHGQTKIPLEADPALLRQRGGRLYVYSRATGIVEEIDRDRVTRRVTVAPYASDLEISGDTAYLVYPHSAKVRTVDLKTMKTSGELVVGAVPVDLAFAGGGTALTARILAVADPSSKRIWLAEANQSMTEAIARGFLRGVLGLGLFGNRSSQFPTGVDRVAVRGKSWVAYDSSSGTLYQFTRSKSSVVAKGVPPGAWTLTGNGVAWWNGTSVAEKRLQ